MLRKFVAAAAVAAMLGWAGTASAELITITGTTSGGGVSGTANIELVGGQLQVTLANTTADVTNIAQTLVGFSFVWNSPVRLSALDTVLSTGGYFTCSGNQGSGGTCGTYTLTSTDFSPFGWTLTAGGTNTFKAGNGSWKPWEIVNESIVGGVLDGLGNSQHVPYLGGPVVFTFNLNGALTELPRITSATMYWGTTGEGTTTQVPEPASALLLGTGLVGLGMAVRRRRS